jgi:NAD(P)-dependent dehydrogenase (short-subunit alcohol dehydrogenase family)
MALPAKLRAVVTGAGSGLGRAFCTQLARRGARVVAADVDLAAAEATVAQLAGAEARAIRCDVAQPEAVRALAEQAEQWLGGVDLLVNNAGVAVSGPVGEIPLADWSWIVGVNLWGVVHGCHEFVPRFRRQGHGHVLNVASAAGLLSLPQMAPYNATKAAVVALSETLHGELAGSNVGVTVLCPTFFRTNIVASARGASTHERQLAEWMMARSKYTADDVARLALEGADRGQLYVVPHADGRWLWRLQRASPRGFYALLPRLMNLQSLARPKANP